MMYYSIMIHLLYANTAMTVRTPSENFEGFSLEPFGEMKYLGVLQTQLQQFKKFILGVT